MSDALLPKRQLFRFSVPCLYRSPLWTPQDTGLEPKYRLVNFAELEGQTAWAEVRVAWSEEGLAFSVAVEGKKQPPWCRASRPEESDGLQVWLDTRDVHNVHRAGRFCHRFLFAPTGDGSRLDQAWAQWMPINRAKEHPRAIKTGKLQVRADNRSDGYQLHALINVDALTGFDPQEHPRLGFTYALLDRELGEQTLSVGSPLPYQEDPSLWATLELVK
ncbi:MAG: hypothetical protein ABFD16_02370 [Thermoguttaceae bacterium]